MVETAATRSAALALAGECALMRQGWQFLDEKRMLLAAEMLRGLRAHEALEVQLLQGLRAARDALQAALRRHGLEGLQAYPAAALETAPPAPTRSRFLGVTLLNVAFDVPADTHADDGALDASPEARACRAAFLALLAPLVRLAASAANLERLAAEYRRTERRARALENVLLPEIERASKAIDEQLELADQEEAVRIRLAAHRA